MLRQDAIQPALELPKAEGRARGRGVLATARNYLDLTKPRIIVLLLVTTVPAMVFAQQGMPSLWLIVLTLLGGTLAAAGANAINCYVDRDIDGMMSRTKERPLPSGSIEPERALIFGLALGIASFAILGLWVNLASALLAFTALAYLVPDRRQHSRRRPSRGHGGRRDPAGHPDAGADLAGRRAGRGAEPALEQRRHVAVGRGR